MNHKLELLSFKKYMSLRARVYAKITNAAAVRAQPGSEGCLIQMGKTGNKLKYEINVMVYFQPGE